MRDIVAASDLLERAASAIGLSPELLAEVFDGAPSDFQVILSPTLPFRVDLFGMTGITLRGRVHLRESVLRGSAADLIVLLRHEAEHVRQQRGDALFYFRYIRDWLGGFVSPRRGSFNEGLRGRWHRAYMGIGAEREAYEADARARRLINRK